MLINDRSKVNYLVAAEPAAGRQGQFAGAWWGGRGLPGAAAPRREDGADGSAPFIKRGAVKIAHHCSLPRVGRRFGVVEHIEENEAWQR